MSFVAVSLCLCLLPFLFQANVKLKYGTLSHHQCGGAIVGPHHVVTAAHCLVANSPGEYEVTVGDDDRDAMDEEEQTFQVESFKKHPKFSGSKHYYGFNLGTFMRISLRVIPIGNLDMEGLERRWFRENIRQLLIFVKIVVFFDEKCINHSFELCVLCSQRSYTNSWF